MRRLASALLALLMIGLMASGGAMAAEPYGAIGEKYAALGGRGGALGPAIGNEADAPHGGRYHLFKEGVIYWHPEIGAYAVWGAIAAKYWQLGRAEYGYPITDESVTPDGRGRYNHFRAMHVPGRPESSIYWTPEHGAFAVYGAIRDAWARAGWERSEIGYPTSDEFDENGGRRQNFERGHILWTPGGGARIVKSGAGVGILIPPNTFGSHLVRGVEVSLRGQRLAGNPNFLSENVLCGAFNAARPKLEQRIKGEIFANIAPAMRPFGLHPDYTHLRLSQRCSFKAEIAQVCGDSVRVRGVLPRNLLEVQITTPDLVGGVGIGEAADPELVMNFDLAFETVILIPRNGGGRIGLGESKAIVTLDEPDSDNFTGDVGVAVLKLYDMLEGKKMLQRFFTTHVIDIPGIDIALSELGPAFSRIPANYRVESCVGQGDILRINGTDSAEPTGPIVK